ncbi:MAG: tetratricopeptide repeat protein, partial [Gammaproteobacteria bacterium]|nr:tetratricopeptide repeat protein [Gammaproteobacteria bacterium]
MVYAKGNEFIRTAAAAGFDKVYVGTEVSSGDELVTGAYGSLAIVLRDETQIRLRHSSRFTVGEIRDAGSIETTRMELLAGAMWSRAQSLARQVSVGLARKPVVNVTIATATIGIRGTDWFVSLDEATGVSRTVIISGAGEVSNPLGSVTLASGEEAIVEPGKAPVKRVVVDLSGRPLMALEYDVDWQRLADAPPGSTLASAAELAGEGRFAEAAGLLDSLPRPSADAAVERFRVALLMNNADYDAAIALARDARNRFPAASDFDALLGHAYLLTDQPDAMREAIDDGLARNADDERLWHLRGIYYTLVQPDRDAALGAYETAIALRADASESLNNLGLLNFQLGHFDDARANLAAAREARPDNALVHANSGFLALNLDKLDAAEGHLQRAGSLDEASPHLHMARGTQALMAGDHAAAIEHFVTAIAIEPVLPGAHTSLAIAYYQAGRFDEGRAMIDKAIQIDPDDPIAPKIGTTMSLDQADIGRAIRLAKDALAKSLEYDYFAVESLASARSGVTNLGAAYSSLGLTSWANYYAQLAFTPYEATSHFLLSNVYAARSNSASNGALNLGLVIAPTAISEPNRFFEFIREPGIDFTLGGSLGDSGGQRTQTGDATVQGFVRAPVPVAWRMDYLDNDSSNGAVSSQTLNISAGTRFGDRRHHLSANLFATTSDSENVSPINEIDRGDRSDSSALAASLAYTLRLDYENRIVARLGYQQLETGTRNLRPFGSGVSDLVQSLIVNFGEDTTRGIAELGLYDLNTFLGPPCSATDPCLGISDFFIGFPGATPVAAAVPELIADDIFVSTDSRVRSYYLQLRHMIRLGDVDLSYGIEFTERESRRKFVINDTEFVGVGTLIDDAVNFFPFALFQTISDSSRSTTRPDSGFAYAQARYEYSDTLWFEGGLFGRYY